MKLQVKVFPKSSRKELVTSAEGIKAYIKEAPDKGKANKALIELIAEEYGVRKSSVRIVTGLTSRNKIVEITEK